MHILSGRNEAGKDFPHSEKGGKKSCKKCGHSATGVELYLTPNKHCFSKCPPGFIGDHNDHGSPRHQLRFAGFCDDLKPVDGHFYYYYVPFVHCTCFDFGRALDFPGSFIDSFVNLRDFIVHGFPSGVEHFDCHVGALLRERNFDLVGGSIGLKRVCPFEQVLHFVFVCALYHSGICIWSCGDVRDRFLKLDNTRVIVSCRSNFRFSGDVCLACGLEHLGVQLGPGIGLTVRFQHCTRQAYYNCHGPHQRMHELYLSFRDVSRFASSSVEHRLGIDVDFDFDLRVRVSHYTVRRSDGKRERLHHCIRPFDGVIKLLGAAV
ncbi:hypothetical protein RQP46_008721 [Phenoliferia psychrophenolica]